jgi:acyl dehydratase
MTLELDLIRNLDVKPVRETYGKKETILYALGLGYGRDPMDAGELPFVYEGDDFRAVPTMCNVLCHPGFWAKDPKYGIDWVKILHAEQALELHRPLDTAASVRGEYRVSAVEDKGAEKGALLHQEKLLYDDSDDTLLATVRSTLFMRGNGGQGTFGTPPEPSAAIPDRAPDRSVEIQTRMDQALIYRLSGDWNPLHADPQIARQAGFPAPILHGLCTNGLACKAILEAYLENDTSRFQSMFVRFSRPVMPGDTIRFDFFEGDRLTFRAVAVERDVTVLDRCTATFT